MKFTVNADTLEVRNIKFKENHRIFRYKQGSIYHGTYYDCFKRPLEDQEMIEKIIAMRGVDNSIDSNNDQVLESKHRPVGS